MPEPHLQRFDFQEVKFIGSVEARHWQMVLGRPQILPHGENVNFASGQIAEDGEQLAHLFAQSGH